MALPRTVWGAFGAQESLQTADQMDLRVDAALQKKAETFSVHDFLAECSYLRTVIVNTVMTNSLKRSGVCLMWVMVRWKCNQGVRREPDLTTYRSSPRHPSEATPSQISTRPERSDITGHIILIFHSSEYRLAVNRIYTSLSMSHGVLALPVRHHRDVLSFHGGALQICPAAAQLVTLRSGRDDMEFDRRGENGICVSSTLDKNQEQQRWVTSCFTFLPSSPELLKALTTAYLWSRPPPVCGHYITGLVYQCRWSTFLLHVQKYVLPTIKCRDSCRTGWWNITTSALSRITVKVEILANPRGHEIK